jgi:hypothetical protein
MSLSDIKSDVTKSIRETEARVSVLVKEIELFISSYIGRFMAELEEDDEPDAIARLGELIQGMKSAGLDDKLAQIGRLYGEELKKANETFIKYGGGEMLQINEDTIRALIQFKVEQVENIALTQVGNLRPVIVQQIITGEPFNVQELVDKVSSRTLAHIETELNTAMIAFNRTVAKAQAERLGIEKFLYVGPDDKITRPFCNEVLNDRNPPVYTSDEIANMDNGQGLDVSQYGGGYNCRHEWLPVTDEIIDEL